MLPHGKSGPSAAFWKNKKVFLTGHTGFKGGWLSLWLHKLGAEVTGYALEPATEPSLYDLAGIGDRIKTSIFGDIRDGEKLTAAMQAAEPDIVFHLAAQPIVRQSYVDPVGTYQTNVMGTINVFEAVRGTPSVLSVVNVTSDKCYENHEWDWPYREADAMGGFDPYSNSKGCAELVTSAYRRSFFSAPGSRKVALASVRAGNVIGGGDWAPDRLIPDVIRGISSGKATVIRNPNSVRPWQHVLEPLSGYLLVAERLVTAPDETAEAWNFGPLEDDAVPVSNVLDLIVEATGGRAQWNVESDATAPHEAKLLRLDISKARSRLGWRPKWRLETAVTETARWYLAALDGKDAYKTSIEQIEAFESSPAGNA